jgi:hypothetical protein
VSLSGPRGAALRRLAADARAVVTGHGPRRRVVPGEPAIPARSEAHLRTALAAGDQATALKTAEAIVRDHPDHILALETLLADRRAIGEPSAARELMARIRAIVPTRPSASAAADAAVVMTLVTSKPGWLPRLPGPPRPVTSDPDSPPLELSDESVLAGFEPGVPLDEALTAAAWRADRQARAGRASGIHVSPAPGTTGAMQVGLAVHRHTGLPLRVGPWRDDPTIPAGSELARRRRAIAEAIAAEAAATAEPATPVGDGAPDDASSATP